MGYIFGFRKCLVLFESTDRMFTDFYLTFFCWSAILATQPGGPRRRPQQLTSGCLPRPLQPESRSRGPSDGVNSTVPVTRGSETAYTHNERITRNRRKREKNSQSLLCNLNRAGPGRPGRGCSATARARRQQVIQSLSSPVLSPVLDFQ